jgi:hypothetical protein
MHFHQIHISFVFSYPLFAILMQQPSAHVLKNEKIVLAKRIETIHYSGHSSVKI